jgi:hypothetical protein
MGPERPNASFAVPFRPAILESYWGVPISDVYGMSEAPGFFGRRCRECPRFHLSACSIVETLAPTNNARSRRAMLDSS